MSYTIIFALSIVLMAVLTVILYVIVKCIFNRLECRLSALKPRKCAEETSTRGNTRNTLLALFNFLLVFFIGFEGLTSSLSDTVLNPDFLAGEIRKLDLTAVATDLLARQSSDMTNGSVAGELADDLYAAASIESTLAEMGPAVVERLTEAVYEGYDYLFGDIEELSLSVMLSDLKLALRQNLESEIIKSPPSHLGQAGLDSILLYAGQIYEDRFARVPEALELNSASSSSGVVNRIEEARSMAVYLPVLPVVALVVILLMVALIIIVHNDFKAALWEIGIVFIAAGLVDFLYTFIAQKIGASLDGLAFVPTLNLWLIQVVSDVLITIKQPLYLLVGVGAGLLAVSFLMYQFKSGRQAVAGGRGFARTPLE